MCFSQFSLYLHNLCHLNWICVIWRVVGRGDDNSPLFDSARLSALAPLRSLDVVRSSAGKTGWVMLSAFLAVGATRSRRNVCMILLYFISIKLDCHYISVLHRSELSSFAHSTLLQSQGERTDRYREMMARWLFIELHSITNGLRICMAARSPMMFTRACMPWTQCGAELLQIEGRNQVNWLSPKIDKIM